MVGGGGWWSAGQAEHDKSEREIIKKKMTDRPCPGFGSHLDE